MKWQSRRDDLTNVRKTTVGAIVRRPKPESLRQQKSAERCAVTSGIGPVTSSLDRHVAGRSAATVHRAVSRHKGQTCERGAEEAKEGGDL